MSSLAEAFASGDQPRPRGAADVQGHALDAQRDCRTADFDDGARHSGRHLSVRIRRRGCDAARLRGIERLERVNSPSEERVMRAREVVALVERCRRASASRRGDPILLRAAEMLETLAIESGLAPIADEGSGIGEREGYALVPIEPTNAMLIAGGMAVAQNVVDCPDDGPAAEVEMRDHCLGEARATWRAMIAASPDIDRSGLAQEVE